MNKHSILFIGLDTHKEFNEVAYIEEHRGAQHFILFMKQGIVVIGFTD